jgi:hypothetical protein
VCCLLLAAAIFSVAAQTNEQTNRLADIDNKINALGFQIVDQLKKMSVKPLVSVGSFPLQGLITNFGTFINQNIINVLSVNGGGAYQIISTGGIHAQNASSRRADFQIIGEIIDLGQIIRIYTRLLSVEDNSILYSWQTDLQKNVTLMNMMNVSGHVSLPMDMFEFDNIDNPVRIHSGDGTVARNINSENDEDWFVFTAQQDVMLLFIADGRDDFDTRMEIFNSEKTLIAENDDYGEDYDAGIIASVENGETIYIKVFGYDRETGSYSLVIQESLIENESTQTAPRVDF